MPAGGTSVKLVPLRTLPLLTLVLLEMPLPQLHMVVAP